MEAEEIWVDNVYEGVVNLEVAYAIDSSALEFVDSAASAHSAKAAAVSVGGHGDFTLLFEYYLAIFVHGGHEALFKEYYVIFIEAEEVVFFKEGACCAVVDMACHNKPWNFYSVFTLG